ncbi:hypothetical protein PanWU01x14_126600 [Parasponia andersonii]|uniref:Uncharacterized protein n=1 Tax=Parasponia andersonii TaxID=3476 RepID=A0A2P5CSV6_PARAD|nr:hypothetical protein PanWU01x14_126600 [Parasponia andersonii]
MLQRSHYFTFNTNTNATLFLTNLDCSSDGSGRSILVIVARKAGPFLTYFILRSSLFDHHSSIFFNFFLTTADHHNSIPGLFYLDEEVYLELKKNEVDKTYPFLIHVIDEPITIQGILMQQN